MGSTGGRTGAGIGGSTGGMTGTGIGGSTSTTGQHEHHGHHGHHEDIIHGDHTSPRLQTNSTHTLVEAALWRQPQLAQAVALIAPTL
jgi:ABC-type Zn2+ transport system substrate-binding protein/surface adhesin